MSNSIQKLRIKKGLTQAGLAAALGENRSTVAMWESGNSLPRASKLPEIAEMLNCTIDELLSDKPKTN